MANPLEQLRTVILHVSLPSKELQFLMKRDRRGFLVEETLDAGIKASKQVLFWRLAFSHSSFV